MRREAARLLFVISWAYCAITSAQTPAVPTTPVAPTATATRADRPLATRQMSFAIPFTIDKTAIDVQEVQLLVSADRGATWHIYAKQRPGGGNFHFRAVRDGEYWFASKTIDAQSAAAGAMPTTAELRVLIDTAMPRVTLMATPGPAGDVKTNWEIHDEYLDAKSFSLEYQSAIGEAWQPIAVDPASLTGDSTTLKGQLTWWPKSPSKVVNIKAEVRDFAGNLGVVQKRIFLPTPLARKPTPPVSSNSGATGGTTAGPPQDPFARAFSNPPPAVPPTAVTPTAPLTSQPVVAPSNPSSPIANQFPNAPTPTPPAPQMAFPNAAPAVDSSKEIPTPSPTSLASAPASTTVVTQEDRRPPVQTPIVAELPGGERPRMTNSKRFALEYDIESVGPGGVAEVELWGTKDRGANWMKWGTDPDRKSPYELDVPDEGLYGFRVVIVSKSGLTSPTPQPGDLADLWVGVDVTSPKAELTSISYGEAPFAGQLDIRWTATDNALGARPVTLSFSEKSDGPWTTIASGLPNSGQYYWSVDARVPKKIFLRLEVRDEAGNATHHQTPQLISLEGLTPGARIKGLHSTSNLLLAPMRR